MAAQNFDWDYKDKLPSFKALWKDYLNEYFEGNINQWLSKGEPYIFYKHLFRKFIFEKIGVKEKVRDMEGRVVGKKPHHTTVFNSLNKDPKTFKLTKKQLTQIVKFLNVQYEQNKNAKYINTINKYLNRGYTKEDVARDCLVHRKAIERILQRKRVPYHVLQQIDKNLNHEIS